MITDNGLINFTLCILYSDKTTNKTMHMFEGFIIFGYNSIVFLIIGIPECSSCKL